MKLLHLTNHFPPYVNGVGERQCRLMVNEFASRGHFSRVLTSDFTVAGVPDRERMVDRRLSLASSESDAPFSRLVLNERRNLAALVEVLEQFNPDMVMIWSMAGLSNSLLWELQRRGQRTLFAVLDHWPRYRLREDPWMDWWTGRLPFKERALRRCLRTTAFDRVLQRQFPVRRPTELKLARAYFASRALRDSVRGAGYAVEGSEIIPFCLGRDEMPGQSQRRDDVRRILWIGRLDTDRDPMTALQTIQELRHSGQMQFTLDVFGRGDVAFESRLHDYVRDAQLAGAVTIRHASVEELAALFPTYDLFLYTARYPEPFPLVLLRAMAARLPVVTTMEGSCADVARNGYNAIVFRTGDPVDCATKINLVAESRELLEQMTERAYRDVLDNYSAVTVAGRIERLLHELARQRAAA